MNDEEIMQVLKEISDDCFYRKNCTGCCFDVNGSCAIKGMPCDWDLDNISKL